ncbi:MAG: hypothetical protein D6812_15865, partial [Deltaproteobacteria bacterium]
SDGLNGVLGEDRLAELIHEHTTDSAEELVERLVQAALDAGGTDNVTVAVVRVLPEIPDVSMEDAETVSSSEA